MVARNGSVDYKKKKKNRPHKGKKKKKVMRGGFSAQNSMMIPLITCVCRFIRKVVLSIVFSFFSSLTYMMRYFTCHIPLLFVYPLDWHP